MKAKKKWNVKQKSKRSDYSSSSESDKQGSNIPSSCPERRSSSRLKNQSQHLQKTDSPEPSHVTLADSAYDADEESCNQNTSPQQSKSDPYAIDMIEDILVPKPKKERKSKPNSKKSKKARSANNSNGKNAQTTTSTPVLNNGAGTITKLHDCNTDNSLSVTPEVTPILPVKSIDCSSPSDSYLTPQIRRSARKRDCRSDSASSISANLNCSSQGDSGIVVSPMSKKRRTNSNSSEGKLKEKSGTLTGNEKKDHFPKAFGRQYMNKRNIFSPNSKANVPELWRCGGLSDCSKNDSCFGFDSLGSPVFPEEKSPPRKSKRALKSKKDKDAYRENISDSSPANISKGIALSMDSDSSPGNFSSSGSVSPPLFSDDVFSVDSESMEVNKSNCKSYKPLKSKKIVSKVSNKKLDDWASNFNMEIEDIEKFDLNIE